MEFVFCFRNTWFFSQELIFFDRNILSFFAEYPWVSDGISLISPFNGILSDKNGISFFAEAEFYLNRIWILFCGIKFFLCGIWILEEFYVLRKKTLCYCVYSVISIVYILDLLACSVIIGLDHWKRNKFWLVFSQTVRDAGCLQRPASVGGQKPF